MAASLAQTASLYTEITPYYIGTFGVHKKNSYNMTVISYQEAKGFPVKDN